jgi:UDP-N-acetylglucosamine--N-acetylmuramyl-(pentapeptide) pyrophosphoryl-undecaprenol N-acetylglucosamine transferase
LKLLIAGGGTGGHVFPALAVAREFLARGSGREVLFVGTERGMESRLVPQAGFRLETIRAAGLKGMGLVRFVRNFAMLAPGLWDSAAILRRHRFNVGFGVGGYAAGPVMLLVAIGGLPTVIFEPNAEAGFTNRVLAELATRTATGYASVAERLGRRAAFTGIPVRPEFFALVPRRPELPYHVLITGGSQGAHAINRAVMAALESLAPQKNRLAIFHQTGERDYNQVRLAYAQRDFSAEVAPFFLDMPERFSQADLIICRSGAITAAEVAASGRAALFIPFPAATDNHQLKNAQAMVDAGAARLLPENVLSGERLAQEILALIGDPNILVALGARARQMARPAAAADIVSLIEQVARS